ncbi:MAG: hypothetical protein DRQ56_04765 [Gammaproteobacteria bacterium]|nr:MAG: hypothetical protein DRQ56_04765 [Gammaproteobacteria bacterium]
MASNDEREQLKGQQSKELQAWLERRSEIAEIRIKMMSIGGCDLPRDSAVDPDYLQGDLRREARCYFKKLKEFVGPDE